MSGNNRLQQVRVCFTRQTVQEQTRIGDDDIVLLLFTAETRLCTYVYQLDFDQPEMFALRDTTIVKGTVLRSRPNPPPWSVPASPRVNNNGGMATS